MRTKIRCFILLFCVSNSIAELSWGQVNLTTHFSRPVVLVSRASDQDYARVELLSIDADTLKPGKRVATELGCQRVYAAANGQVICYSKIIPGKPKYYVNPTAHVFSADFNLIHSHRPARGIISRARISKDGLYFATSSFTTGHSYLGVGGTSFSTATMIGVSNIKNSEENIQKWIISQNDKVIDSPDLNLWGVTFDPRNSAHFFVTVYFAGKPHLGEGDVTSKKIKVLKEGIECPSFSADGLKLAFKKRTSATAWSPAVFELSTGKETIYIVPNSVDDQIEWLDNNTLLYEVIDTPLVGKPTTNIMALDLLKKKGEQSLWLSDARSPSVIR